MSAPTGFLDRCKWELEKFEKLSFKSASQLLAKTTELQEQVNDSNEALRYFFGLWERNGGVSFGPDEHMRLLSLAKQVLNQDWLDQDALKRNIIKHEANQDT